MLHLGQQINSIENRVVFCRVRWEYWSKLNFKQMSMNEKRDGTYLEITTRVGNKTVHPLSPKVYPSDFSEAYA